MTIILALVISLELMAIVESEYTDVYNFPMMGILMWDTKQGGNFDLIAYGSVTILHKQVVLCAAENLVQLTPDGSRYIFDDTAIKNLFVYAGSDILQPPRQYDSDKLQFAQVRAVHMMRSSSFVEEIDKNSIARIDWDKMKIDYRSSVLDKFPPGYKFPTDKTVVFNGFGELQWDLALLVLDGDGFKWSAHVLPIAFHWKDGQKLQQQYRDFWDKFTGIEENPHKFNPCSVPGWSPIGNNEIVYHRVAYVRFYDCAEVVCANYPSACYNFLNIRHHICFKSLSYSDACVLDQGAPVVCSWKPGISENPEVWGILVKAFDCGSQGIPLVFARTYVGAAFAKIVMEDSESAFDADEPALLDPTYTERPL